MPFLGRFAIRDNEPHRLLSSDAVYFEPAAVLQGLGISLTGKPTVLADTAPAWQRDSIPLGPRGA